MFRENKLSQIIHRENQKIRAQHGERKWCRVSAVLAVLVVGLTACGTVPALPASTEGTPAAYSSAETYETVQEVPEYTGEPYVEINENQPEFEEEQLTTVSYETYSELDGLGRCGTAQACIGEDLMPTEDREDISSVVPTGWENHEYDIVDGGYVYNRCHLIGYQLSGENANEENLITGTRYMNTEGMLPFENMVAEYVHETENHVLYRVTPIFEEDNLVASGVQMEAESVEDQGEGICFNVYVYNVQPEIVIDYSTGENWEETDAEDEQKDAQTAAEQEYVLNTNTRKFHNPDCASVDDMKEKNKEVYTGSREDLISQGYEPCGRCKP